MEGEELLERRECPRAPMRMTLFGLASAERPRHCAADGRRVRKGEQQEWLCFLTYIYVWVIAVARYKIDNSRSQSAFFEFLLKVAHGLVVPALREKNGRNKQPTVGVYSPEQGSGSWSEGGQHIQREEVKPGDGGCAKPRDIPQLPV
jgi:hypothetical protein